MPTETKSKKLKMPRTQSGYEDLLVEMIEARTGAAFDTFLTPQVAACAQTWTMMNRVYKDLMKQKRLTDMTIGSQMQQKEEVNPLLPYYLKLQAELRLQFEALGLNYRATPKKITENTKRGGEEQNKLMDLLHDLQ